MPLWGCNDAAPDPEQKITLQNRNQPFSTVPGRTETLYQWVEKLSYGGGARTEHTQNPDFLGKLATVRSRAIGV